MDYDFFALYTNSPVYYSCRRLSENEYELTLKGYSEPYFDEGLPPQRLVLTRGKRWTCDDPQDKEFLDELVARLTAWEKDQNLKRTSTP